MDLREDEEMVDLPDKTCAYVLIFPRFHKKVRSRVGKDKVFDYI